MTPRELIAHAKEIGLRGLSITDHDSISAYPQAFEDAKNADLLLGTGVEFSAHFEGMSVHVLGYHFSIESKEIRQLCERHVHRRARRNQQILEKLEAKRMPITLNEIQGNLIGRPHIAHKMVEKGYVFSVKEAFNKFLAEGRACYVQGELISVSETIQTIKAGGGKAFLAHPHLLQKGPWIKRLLLKPFDGLECYYSRCDLSSEKRWLKVCQERGLLVSGGSDFHGSAKPFIPLGSSWVDETKFNQIFS
jgi:hypothetical protein